MNSLENLGKKLNSISQERTRPYLIGISGGSGCGKSTLSKLLYENLGPENCLMFSMDTYYKDLTPEQEKNLNQYNFDIPDALDLDLLSYHLSSLMNWENIEMPTYSFETNKRQKEVENLKPNKFIIFEGILAFHDKRMRDLMDIKIFIEIDDDIRLARRIYRDMIYRKRKMETIIERYYQFVKPAYETYIKPTRLFADIIIPRGSSNTIIIDLLNYHLKYMSKYLFPNGIKKFLKDKKNENIDKKNNEFYDENDGDFVLGKGSCKSLFKVENIQNINYEKIFEENISLINDEMEKKNYLVMFKNYLTGNKIHYFDLYTDLFIKKIYEFVKNKILVYKNFDIEKINSEINTKREKFLEKNENLNVYIFVPILLEKSEKIEKILKTLKENKDVNLIYIVCIFLSKDMANEYFLKDKIILKSVYCGNILKKYKDFIDQGGYFKKKDLFTSVICFSENNLERRLAEYIEINQ